MAPGQREPRTLSAGRLWESWGITLILVLLIIVAAIIDPAFVSASNSEFHPA